MNAKVMNWVPAHGQGARLASDNDYQLLAQGQCFSPGTPASTERHDMAEILLKVALNTIN
jgi:hypothetical protein